MAKIIELDNHFEMTAEQTLERARRADLSKIIIIGSHEEKGLILFMSDMERMEAFWALSKATQAVFDE